MDTQRISQVLQYFSNMLEAIWHRGRAEKREGMKISRGSEGDREKEGKGGGKRQTVTAGGVILCRPTLDVVTLHWS